MEKITKLQILRYFKSCVEEIVKGALQVDEKGWSIFFPEDDINFDFREFWSVPYLKDDEDRFYRIIGYSMKTDNPDLRKYFYLKSRYGFDIQKYSVTSPIPYPRKKTFFQAIEDEKYFYYEKVMQDIQISLRPLDSDKPLLHPENLNILLLSPDEITRKTKIEFRPTVNSTNFFSEAGSFYVGLEYSRYVGRRRNKDGGNEYYDAMYPLYLAEVEIRVADGGYEMELKDFSPTFFYWDKTDKRIFPFFDEYDDGGSELQELEKKITLAETNEEKIRIYKSELADDIEIECRPFIVSTSSENLWYYKNLIADFKKLSDDGDCDLTDFSDNALGFLFQERNLLSRAPIQNLLEVARMNDEQRTAVEKCLSENFSVIVWPPGTGKSQVVVNLLANIYHRNETALFVSFNNQAINTVTRKFNDLWLPNAPVLALKDKNGLFESVEGKGRRPYDSKSESLESAWFEVRKIKEEMSRNMNEFEKFAKDNQYLDAAAAKLENVAMGNVIRGLRDFIPDIDSALTVQEHWKVAEDSFSVATERRIVAESEFFKLASEFEKNEPEARQKILESHISDLESAIARVSQEYEKRFSSLTFLEAEIQKRKTELNFATGQIGEVLTKRSMSPFSSIGRRLNDGLMDGLIESNWIIDDVEKRLAVMENEIESSESEIEKLNEQIWKSSAVVDVYEKIFENPTQGNEGISISRSDERRLKELRNDFIEYGDSSQPIRFFLWFLITRKVREYASIIDKIENKKVRDYFDEFGSPRSSPNEIIAKIGYLLKMPDICEKITMLRKEKNRFESNRISRINTLRQLLATLGEIGIDPESFLEKIKSEDLSAISKCLKCRKTIASTQTGISLAKEKISKIEIDFTHFLSDTFEQYGLRGGNMTYEYAIAVLDRVILLVRLKNKIKLLKKEEQDAEKKLEEVRIESSSACIDTLGEGVCTAMSECISDADSLKAELVKIKDAVRLMKVAWEAKARLSELADLSDLQKKLKSASERLEETSLRALDKSVRESFKGGNLTVTKNAFDDIFDVYERMKAKGNARDYYDEQKKRDFMQNAYRNALKASRIVVTTNLSTSLIPLGKSMFDYLVVDEASQNDMASLVPLLYRCRKLVIIGDPNQLPAIPQLPEGLPKMIFEQKLRNEDVDPIGFSNDFEHYYHAGERGRGVIDHSAYKSFERLLSNVHGKAPEKLTCHYRCHPDIIAFSNEIVADYNLYAKTYVRENAVEDSGIPIGIHWQNVVDKTEAKRNANSKEAEEIVKFIKSVIETGKFGAFSIWIISPYKNQVTLIKEKLQSLAKYVSVECVTVATVHAFQGDERDVILYSPVYPNSGRWNDKRLLNVAVSRARSSFIIFGNSEAAKKCKMNEYGGEEFLLAKLAEHTDLVKVKNQALSTIFADESGLGTFGKCIEGEGLRFDLSSKSFNAQANSKIFVFSGEDFPIRIECWSIGKTSEGVLARLSPEYLVHHSDEFAKSLRKVAMLA